MKAVTKKILELLQGQDKDEISSVLDELRSELATSKETEKVSRPYTNILPEGVWNLLKARGEEVADFEGEDFEPTLLPQIDKIGKDIRSVSFNFENAEFEKSDHGFYQERGMLGPRYFGPVPGVGCYAGGDWEFPVFFFVYLDEDGKTLRAYVPKDGNIWNYDSNEAFGNSDDDAEFFSKWVAKNKPDFKFDPSEFNQHQFDMDRSVTLLFDEEKIEKDVKEHFGFPVK